jgi:hypothetical protein
MNPNEYRLHIDIPLGKDVSEARNLADHLIEIMRNEFYGEGLRLIQYKLSHDSDRGNKNYLDINENGHASNKKVKIEFGADYER